jgi:uncharacterized GH25 family protein
LLLLALPGSALRAHDFWIEPSSFHPAPGARVAVRLKVGQQLKGDPMPRDPQRIERFAAIGPAGETPVPGVAGTEPAGFVSFRQPGLYLLVYDSNRETVDLDADKFEKYLADEGLETVSAQRAKRGQSRAGARDAYSRCAKSLLRIGDGPGNRFDRALGLELELIPEADPTTLPPGSELPVRLLYRGKPLAGALVAALQREDPNDKVSARSDAKGRVRLRLDRPGMWLVKAVHMIPPSPGVDADWESLWASLTFEVPGK